MTAASLDTKVEEPGKDLPPVSRTSPEDLPRIEPIRSKYVRGLLWLILVVIPGFVITLLVLYGPFGLSDASTAGRTMFMSGLVTAETALIAFQALMNRTPETFLTLWRRGILRSRVESTDYNNAKDYESFVEGLTVQLNGLRQLIGGVVFLVFPLFWLPYVYALSDIFTVNGLVIFMEFGAAFIVGLMAWRMLFIGRGIAQTVTKFELTPQIKHPDHCGGLEPLGFLCLWNALIISIPCIFLGGWILILRTPSFFQVPGSQALPADALSFISFYENLFSRLLIVPFAFALITFFFPLWSVHRVMVAKADPIKKELDEIARRIDILARQILDESKDLNPEAVDAHENKIKELDLLQAIYEQNRNIPVWPFNMSILLRFASLQVVPVLSLLGWGQPLLNLLNSLLTGTKSS